MQSIKLKCGRCASEFEVPPLPFSNAEASNKVACPLCGYSKQDVVESVDKPKKKILKG